MCKETIKEIFLLIKPAIIPFLGVILGGFLTFISTYFLDERKFKRDKKLHLLRKREEVYISASAIVYKLCNLLRTNPTTEESEKIICFFREEREKIAPAFALYASKNTSKLFSKLLGSPETIHALKECAEYRLKREGLYSEAITNAENFLKLIKEELEIQD